MEQLTKYNHNIPDWLFPHMQKECTACGAPIVDAGNPDWTGKLILTQRYCPNPYCPKHMAMRIVNVASYLGAQGYGPATCESMVHMYNLKNHLEAIPYIVQGEKPTVHLWEVGVMAQIYGLGNKWKEILLGYSSFEDFFANADFIPYGLDTYRDYLINAQNYFNIKAPLSKRVIRIMISGSINGFSNKHEFVPWLNDRIGKYLQVMEVGKRKSNVDFLVKEPTSVDHAKTALALEVGIPIVSSSEFLQVILAMIKNVEQLGQL